MNDNERLDRIEKIVTAMADQQGWMIQWVDSKFTEVRKEIAEVRKEVAEVRKEVAEVRGELVNESKDARTYVDLKIELVLGDFRAFREMYQHLSARVDTLERVCGN